MPHIEGSEFNTVIEKKEVLDMESDIWSLLPQTGGDVISKKETHDILKLTHIYKRCTEEEHIVKNEMKLCVDFCLREMQKVKNEIRSLRNQNDGAGLTQREKGTVSILTSELLLVEGFIIELCTCFKPHIDIPKIDFELHQDGQHDPMMFLSDEDRQELDELLQIDIFGSESELGSFESETDEQSDGFESELDLLESDTYEKSDESEQEDG